MLSTNSSRYLLTLWWGSSIRSSGKYGSDMPKKTQPACRCTCYCGTRPPLLLLRSDAAMIVARSTSCYPHMPHWLNTLGKPLSTGTHDQQVSHQSATVMLRKEVDSNSLGGSVCAQVLSRSLQPPRAPASTTSPWRRGRAQTYDGALSSSCRVPLSY